MTKEELRKDLVCDDCGCTKFYPKLGGVVCNECKTFYSYELLRKVKEKKISNS